MMKLYHQVCQECSQLITQRYSTSFSMGIHVFDRALRPPIYAIYGFVRFADEIVDTFHQHAKADLLERFGQDTYRAIDEGVSLNPVLHTFQQVVNEYGIEREHIEAFLYSMKMDLEDHEYNDELYEKYIYGSAEVVGLMCLRVFCKNNEEQYEKLKAPARSLGAAFQKVNFLRDIKSDYYERGRTYFPNVDFRYFTNDDKLQIEADIKADFDHAYEGIVRLPKGARFGVYLAYVYYNKLFNKIKNTKASVVANERIRVNDGRKLMLLFSSALRSRLNLF